VRSFVRLAAVVDRINRSENEGRLQERRVGEVSSPAICLDAIKGSEFSPLALR
jgi:hypothetical protein